MQSFLLETPRENKYKLLFLSGEGETHFAESGLFGLCNILTGVLHLLAGNLDALVGVFLGDDCSPLNDRS